jgi:hypothetical protein
MKSAEIIPFPGNKIIKFPTVSRYPDFITGVEDLRARLKSNEISADTYSKLYTDLINYFRSSRD